MSGVGAGNTPNYHWQKPGAGDSKLTGNPWAKKIQDFMDDVDQKIFDLGGSDSGLAGRILTLEGEYTDQQESLNSLDTQLDALAGSITTLDGRVSNALTADSSLTPALTGMIARKIVDMLGEHPTLRGFGAKGDGVTPDDLALQLALNCGRRVYGTPGDIYYINSMITVTANVDLDLRGATIKIGSGLGATQCMINSGLGVPTAASTAVGDTASGSIYITVANPAGMAGGQWVEVLEQSASMAPAFWAKIISVNGSYVVFDRPTPCKYPGTTTLVNTYTDAMFKNSFALRNCIVDGRSAPANNNSVMGQAFRVQGFKKVVLEDVEFKDFIFGGVNAPSNNIPLVVTQCHDVWLHRLKSHNSYFWSCSWWASECRDVVFEDCVIDTSGFGLLAGQNESVLVKGGHFMGRKRWEADNSLPTGRSVRGIKLAHNCKARVTGAHVSDYDSLIKLESNIWDQIDGCTLTDSLRNTQYAGVAINSGGTAAQDVKILGHVWTNNVVENVGTAFSVYENAGSPWSVIANNIVNNTDFMAITMQQYARVVLSGNQISNWGLAGLAGNQYAVYGSPELTAVNNKFYHTNTTLPCFYNTWPTGGSRPVYYAGNISPTGNPIMINGSGNPVYLENRGTCSIASGATTVVVNHGLARAPEVADIIIGFTGSSASGVPYATNITSTQFTINIPNAWGANLWWTAKIKMPLTLP